MINQKYRKGTKVNVYWSGEWINGIVSDTSIRNCYRIRLNMFVKYFGKPTSYVIVHKINVRKGWI